MRLLHLLILLALAGPLLADGKDAAPPPAPPATPRAPVTPERAAEEILAARAQQDPAALAALAARDDPDPWLVTEALRRRGDAEAALAFAAAALRPDVEGLPAYLAARGVPPEDDPRWGRLAATNDALAAGRLEDALAVLGTDAPPPDADVLDVRLAFGRGAALAGLGRAEEAVAAFEAAGRGAERIGWLLRASWAFHEAGRTALEASLLPRAIGALERTVALLERRSHPDQVPTVLMRLGTAHFRAGAYRAAKAAWNEALARAMALGLAETAASAHENLANAAAALGEYARAREGLARARAAQEALGNHGRLVDLVEKEALLDLATGHYDEALAGFAQALAAFEGRGSARDVARVLGNSAQVHARRGEYDEARARYERALHMYGELGEPGAGIAVRGNLASLLAEIGDLERAEALYGEVLAEGQRSGMRAHVAATRSNLADLRAQQGRYAEALTMYERSLEETEASGDVAGAANTRNNLALLHGRLGNWERALALHEQSLAAQERIGDRMGAALTLGNVASAYLGLQRYEEALATYEEARARCAALGYRAGAVRAQGNAALVTLSMGRSARALPDLERALAAREEIGDVADVVRTMGHIAMAHADLGDTKSALAWLERQRSELRRLGDRGGLARSLTMTGEVHAQRGEWPKALEAAREAAGLGPYLFAGLGDQQGAGARAKVHHLFGLGTHAAAAMGDIPTAVAMLERYRAGSLLEALGAREAIARAVLPPALLASEAQARAREASTAEAYRRALATGNRTEARRLRRALQEAQDEVVAVVDRIQREAKAASDLVYFEPLDLALLAARLAPEEALVLTGLFPQGPLAVVVTTTDTRVVRLPPLAQVEAAASALLAAVETRGQGQRFDDALTAAREAAFAPFALGPEVRRLLIAPDGALAQVPYALLAPSLEVVQVPSGTTHAVLAEAMVARGRGVLALGDPEYGTTEINRNKALALRAGTRHLLPIPATADEARSVGDLVLLGAKASEPGFRDALATRPRWRAVHFACHGFVDAEQPAYSALAVSAAGEDDGLLTVLEVLRTDVPADLVVLSACDTGRGKVLPGEGVLGLARAFMCAGAPRVLCSLWKVEDAATAALMTEFYRLWNPRDGTPGIPAAEALRRAQAFVRSQEAWRHPSYWAAWVLWGLA